MDCPLELQMSNRIESGDMWFLKFDESSLYAWVWLSNKLIVSFSFYFSHKTTYIVSDLVKCLNITKKLAQKHLIRGKVQKQILNHLRMWNIFLQNVEESNSFVSQFLLLLRCCLSI